MPGTPRFDETKLRGAIAESLSWAETLRKLGYLSGGNNSLTLQKYAALWGISARHFDPNAGRVAALARPVIPLEEILVENSAYSRRSLKERLYLAGLKTKRCELCGQSEDWRGRRMALVLDHINGVPNDNRLENLRILCPNCAATLDTHCGRKNGNRTPRQTLSCPQCGGAFWARYPKQRFCSRVCGSQTSEGKGRGVPHPERRKVARPREKELLAEIRETNYCAVARKYGVSDKAIRKWVVWYERERARQAEGPG